MIARSISLLEPERSLSTTVTGDGTPRLHPHLSMSMHESSTGRPDATNDADGEPIDGSPATPTPNGSSVRSIWGEIVSATETISAPEADLERISPRNLEPMH